MRNLKNAKKVIVMIIMMTIMFMFISTNVFAADDNTWSNLSISNNTSRNTATNNMATNNTAKNNTNTSNLSGANAVNTSSYNSTNLPATGLQDSLPIVLLIGVVGISAVYAYKKVKDYQNI